MDVHEVDASAGDAHEHLPARRGWDFDIDPPKDFRTPVLFDLYGSHVRLPVE